MAKALAKTARGGDSPARTSDIAKALAIMAQDDLYDASSVACLGHGGFHRMAYRQWGPGDGRGVVLCVHGLTRNAGDFDDLAAALAVR